MANLSDEELREIEQRADAATPGPWTPEPEPCGPWRVRCPDAEFDYRVLLSMNAGYPCAADLAFIAAVRADVPALVAEVRRLRGQRDEYAGDAERLHAILMQLARHVAAETAVALREDTDGAFELARNVLRDTPAPAPLVLPDGRLASRFWGAQILATSLAETLQKPDGGFWNYFTVSFDSAAGPIDVRVQRRDGQTPEQLRAVAEGERDAARAELRKLRWVVAHERDPETLPLVSPTALEEWLRAHGWSERTDLRRPAVSYFERADRDEWDWLVQVLQGCEYDDYSTFVDRALREIGRRGDHAPALVLCELLPEHGPWDGDGGRDG